jgi:bifunctional non-homologous end joining protein LigD
VKNLAELQAECAALGIVVETTGRESREPYVAALRDYHWRKDHADQPLPVQTMPMLLGSWEDLDESEAREIEGDCHAWIVQPKLDGVRALMHVESDQVRITSRYLSETTFRLSEFQDNLVHLKRGFSGVVGTVLDGELVCPVSAIDTGSTTTASALQAAVAVLSTTPENAVRIQQQHQAQLRLHVFDILRFQGTDVTEFPLVERMNFLNTALRQTDNSHLEMVQSFVVGKASIHRNIIGAGGEGTCWKKLNEPYRPGIRAKHWIKRKPGVKLEGFVSGFKPGNNGHAGVVGAVEFSVHHENGSSVPVAWVSGWSDDERRAMTKIGQAGKVVLNPSFLGRRALIEGQDHSAKARRLRHARILRWLND